MPQNKHNLPEQFGILYFRQCPMKLYLKEIILRKLNHREHREHRSLHNIN